MCKPLSYISGLLSSRYAHWMIVHTSLFAIVVTLPEWLTGSPAIIATSGWALPASVRIAQVTIFFQSIIAFFAAFLRVPS